MNTPQDLVCPIHAVEMLTELFAHLLRQGIEPGKAGLIVMDTAPALLVESGYTPSPSGLLRLLTAAVIMFHQEDPQYWEARIKANQKLSEPTIETQYPEDQDGHITTTA